MNLGDMRHTVWWRNESKESREPRAERENRATSKHVVEGVLQTYTSCTCDDDLPKGIYYRLARWGECNLCNERRFVDDLRREGEGEGASPIKSNYGRLECLYSVSDENERRERKINQTKLVVRLDILSFRLQYCVIIIFSLIGSSSCVGSRMECLRPGVSDDDDMFGRVRDARHSWERFSFAAWWIMPNNDGNLWSDRFHGGTNCLSYVPPIRPKHRVNCMKTFFKKKSNKTFSGRKLNCHRFVIFFFLSLNFIFVEKMRTSSIPFELCLLSLPSLLCLCVVLLMKR